MLTLYTYFRSSAAYRVRIALNLKGLPYHSVPVHLVRDGGQQNAPEYRAKSPLGTVPALEHDGRVLPESLAIIEWLEETRPDAPLLPPAPAERAHVRALALSIACDIHPLQNLRVLAYLRSKLGQDQTGLDAWCRHWIETGLGAYEATLARSGTSGAFSFGDTPTMADICLVPQLFSADRFGADTRGLTNIQRIRASCDAHPAFAAAHPARQPDAEP